MEDRRTPCRPNGPDEILALETVRNTFRIVQIAQMVVRGDDLAPILAKKFLEDLGL